MTEEAVTPRELLAGLGLAENRVKQVIDALELQMRRGGTVMAPDDNGGLAFRSPSELIEK